MDAIESGKPWFRQPLVWMLIVIPGSAVVAGFYTLYLAIVSFDGMVVDDYYKHGKEINRVLRRDHHARDLKLRADIELNPVNAQTRLRMQSVHGYKFPDRLRLRFLHTTRAGHDREVAMIHQGDGIYLGALPQLRAGSWNVLLEDADWRIGGLLAQASRQSVTLAPVQ